MRQDNSAMDADTVGTEVITPSQGEAPSTRFPVSLRCIPYPYRALLAICSDLDETPDRHVYWEIMRYLNTTDITCMGRGVGLEVGNSIYFDMPPEQFSYWNTDERGRDMVRTLIRSGHIDCLHSFGDLAATRAHAGRALDELSRHNCRLEVWVDHAVAPSNFGEDIMRGAGDVPVSPVYHADLTCDFGVQYVWRGRITSVTGQDVPPNVRDIYDPRHPLASVRTVAKEFVKGVLGRRGHSKYAMHGPNRLLREARLRSGHAVWEFLRSNPHWAGVSCGDTAEGLAEVLVAPILARLVEREGVCLLYTHLGKIRNRQEPFGLRTRKALGLLAEMYREGTILVTTTRRLLGYCRAVRQVTLSTSREGEGLRIDLAREGREGGRDLPREDLGGLSLYVPCPFQTRVMFNGREVSDLRRNGPDHTGRRSVSLPWRQLEFPRL